MTGLKPATKSSEANFSADFKSQIVKLYLQGKSCNDLVKGYGLSLADSKFYII
jgi:transposase-like protein